MKKWLLAVPPVVWLLAQAAAPPASPAGNFPRGALAIVEAKDFASLWRQWNASQAKRDWLAGDAYKVFRNSRLGQRLDAALDEFAGAAKVPLDSALVEQLAGSRTAVAVYNIGDLEILAVSRMPAATFALSALGQRRTALQPRNVNGIPYFVSSDPSTRRTFAFGFKDGWAVAGTTESLVAEYLQRNGGGLASEEWYARASAAAGAEGDLRLVANLDALQQSPHFRSYWIQRNRTELAAYGVSVSDLDRSPQEWVERRVLLRKQSAAIAAPGFAWPELLRFIPDNAGLYRAWRNPDPDRSAQMLIAKLLAPGGATVGSDSPAPAASSIVEAGDESDWDVRIDDAPFVDPASGPDPARISAWLRANDVKGLLHVQSTRDQTGNVWIGQEIGIVLLKQGAWNLEQARAAFPDVPLAATGARLFLANQPAMLSALQAANSTLTAAPEAHFAGAFRLSLERARYFRWMARIEQPHARTLAAGETREPDFLDDVVPSVGRLVQPVSDQRVTVTETPAATNQTITYRIAP